MSVTYSNSNMGSYYQTAVTIKDVYDFCNEKLEPIDALLTKFDDVMMRFQLANPLHDNAIMSARVGIDENLYRRKLKLLRVLTKDDVTIRELIMEVSWFFTDAETMISDNISIPELALYVDTNLREYFDINYLMKATYNCLVYAACMETLRDHRGVNSVESYVDCLQVADEIAKTFKSTFIKVHETD